MTQVVSGISRRGCRQQVFFFSNRSSGLLRLCFGERCDAVWLWRSRNILPHMLILSHFSGWKFCGTMLKLWFTLLFCWRKSSPLTFQALNHCDSFYPPGCRLQCLCVKIPETWPQPVLYLYFSFTPAEGGRVLCYASAAAAASYIDIDESLMKTQCHRNHMIILFEYMLNELHRFPGKCVDASR